MKKLITLSIIYLFALSSFSMALDLESVTESVTDTLGVNVGYGAAGCGWGTMLWKGIPGTGANVMASITNGILSNQAFGMSSGTLGCKTNGPVVQNITKEQATFVAVNYDSLSLEMSRGQGEYLTAYAEVIGCPGDQVTQFNTVVKQNYSSIFGEDTQPANVVQNTIAVIQGEPQLANSCIGTN